VHVTHAPTTRLYYEDAYLLTFDAAVVATREGEGRPLVALDRSAFYPTSGGQAHDVGWLTDASGRRVPVVDVHADEAGIVWHVLDAPGAAGLGPGALVHGSVDAARRADHRQQHTGQHVLSASFAHVCGAETRSVHLGAGLCTVDLDRELAADEIDAAETHANRVVLDDRPVRVRQVDGAEAASLPLRRPTTRTGMVRLVEIEGHDLSACGGTHVARTGEVGAIVVCGAERFKGGLRVSFVCGLRAVESHRTLFRTLDATARALSVAAADVPAAVSRLLEELREARRALDEVRARLGTLEAATLASRFRQVGGLQALVETVEADDPSHLRRIATTLVDAAPGRVAVLFGAQAPHAIVVARSADLGGVDAGALARAIALAHGGKAGGRPDVGQGGGLAAVDVAKVEAILRDA
jgi:alanyl-tRNA synthetase